MKPSKLLPLLALLCVAPFASGHEFWIEPASHAPKVGATLAAGLQLGHADDKEAYTRNPRHLAEFSLISPSGKRTPLQGRPGEHPAGRVKLREAGTFVLAYRSKLSNLEMEPAKFEAYLVEEGLEGIVAERKRLGESLLPGREGYSRCAKSLVRTPGADPKGFDQRVGMPLELVPMADPLSYVPGDPERKLAFQLLEAGSARSGLEMNHDIQRSQLGSPF